MFRIANLIKPQIYFLTELRFQKIRIWFYLVHDPYCLILRQRLTIKRWHLSFR